MDVKIVFVNEDFEKEVYIDQLEGFVITRKENLVYKLKKLIYGLKQAFWQWYLKFNNIITSYGFAKKYCWSVYLYEGQREQDHYITSICWWYLLVTNDIWLSYDVENFLSKNFEINNMSETSYVIRI